MPTMLADLRRMAARLAGISAFALALVMGLTWSSVLLAGELNYTPVERRSCVWTGRIPRRCRRTSATIAASMSCAAAGFAQTIAASITNSISARRRLSAAATLATGYCDWNGSLRCAP